MQGWVLKSVGNLYTVAVEGGVTHRCRAKGRLRLDESKATNPIAVGDRVEVELGSDGVGAITWIYPRTNHIIRRASNLSRQTHVIAANIDQALLVVTVGFPETHLEFIDRFLATAEAYRIQPIVAINKIDLYEGYLKEKFNSYRAIYQALYPCLELSALAGVNREALQEALRDKVTLVSGNSGVGKSTLINWLQPELNLKTSGVSSVHQRGTHTTTFSEMFPLSFGGYIIDTPGLKGFGLVDMDRRELYHFFPEIFSRADGCQFYNCTHVHEPECAVRLAVELGQIAPSRYASYRSMLADTRAKYRG